MLKGSKKFLSNRPLTSRTTWSLSKSVSTPSITNISLEKAAPPSTGSSRSATSRSISPTWTKAPPSSGLRATSKEFAQLKLNWKAWLTMLNEKEKDLVIENRFHRQLIGPKGETIQQIRD